MHDVAEDVRRAEALRTADAAMTRAIRETAPHPKTIQPATEFQVVIERTILPWPCSQTRLRGACARLVDEARKKGHIRFTCPPDPETNIPTRAGEYVRLSWWVEMPQAQPVVGIEVASR